MSLNMKRNIAPRRPGFNQTPTRLRRFAAQALAFLLFMQVAAPPALAAPERGLPLAELGAALTATVTAKIGALAGAVGARMSPAPQAAQVVPVTDFGLVLTPLGTAFSDHVGVEHHQPLRSLVVSSNSPGGLPLNFETLDEGGAHRPYSNVAGLQGELRLAVARDDGQGLSLGGFHPGELFTGTGDAGRIARVSADGAAVQNPWVTLPGETGQLGAGLTIDRTGVYGGDLIAVTTSGGVWRVNAAGVATRVASLGTPLEAVATIPNSEAKYGPWAGKILAGATEQGTLYAIDAAGGSTSYQLGVTPGDIRVIPAHENFYGVDAGARKIWGAPDDAFAGIIGDILVAQKSPGVLAHVRWNGAAFEVGRVAEVSRWGQIAFSPAGVAGVAGVKQFYDKLAVVRHAPQLDSGRVEGALWQLTGENVVLDGTDVITSDLLVPGTPSVTVGSGRPTFSGVIAGVEGTQPSNYSVTISNNAVLRHVITRTNPFDPAPVAAPPAPAGARDLSLTKAAQPVGDPATLRHLSLSGQAGAVAVPPGTYGKFTAGGRTSFVFGVANSAQPAVYNLEELALSGGSELRLAGPVVLNVKGNVSLAGSSVGAADNPRNLLLSVADGSVGVTGGGVLYGVVRIPRGSVSIGGNGRVRGTVTCDRLNIYGNGVLQITESDVAPPPVNRPPAADAGPDQTITLPTDSVSLNGVVTDDGLPAGAALTSTWTKVSGPGAVTFANPAGAVTSASFTEPGAYVLRLTASDSLLTASDEMSVEVLPRNTPPVVDAGPDQSIELPSTATLGGTATDDALPRGSTVTTAWSVVSGPGAVTFADAQALSTAATFSAPGTYTLRLTADDTEFTVGDEMVVTVYPENQPPVVSAGPDQTVRAGSALALGGTATDDGLPTGSTLTAIWTKVSGPGAVTFAAPGSPATSATFGIEGTYVLRLTASDTRFEVGDECVVTVLPRNTPPVVNAGPDREVTFLEAATLNGTATDDGLPVGSVVETAWSVVSGPGAVAFASPASTVTAATFAAPGAYVLRLTGDDTQFQASDEMTVVVKPRPHASRVYTLNADFDLGSLINITHSPADQLQLDSTTRSFNFIWVAVSTKGTVVKINTETGAVIGEYLTAPQGQPTDPSRTTVDQNGNVWATNRAGNSVVHIGLVENGQCVDRNGNGQIETSGGFNDIRAWTNAGGANTNGGVTTAADECILHYTRVNSFGTRHVSVNKDNDIWVSGTGGQKFDLLDGKTGIIKRSEPSVGYGGYGGLIDKNNVIWSANPMLRWDTSKPLTGSNDGLNGMAFTLYGGRATWDRAGKSSAQPSPSDKVWVEDSVPIGAALAGDSEGWNWLGANPSPFSGALAHQSNVVGGTHQHYFYGAAETLSVDVGESLFAYVYLDPANPPSQVMLQWNNGSWEHRAYWGQNLIPWGVNGTESRRYMGPLPALGQWVRLEVPASQVGLEGSGANWRGYSHASYGLCIDSGGNVYNTSYGNGTIRKFAPDGTLLGSFNQGMPWAQGCVVDRNDHVWIAHSLSASSVGHMKSDGTYVGTIPVGSGPTGVAVDGAGKVWATNYYSGTVSRINPAAGPLGPDGVTRVGAVDFTTPYLGGNPYNYSDMTGSTLTGAPQTGTWSTVFDSQLAGAEWGRIGWTAEACGDGLLTVTVATSENGTTYTQPVTVSNGDDPAVANGRYIRIVARFERASSGESPVLYDLSVGTVGFPLNTPSNVAPGVNAGPDQTLNGVTQTELKASACDDALPSNRRLTMAWSQVSGPGAATFAKPNSPVTGVTFSATGTYTLRLTASDSGHTSADTVIVTVVPGNQPPAVNAGADQTVVLPATASLGGTVTDDGLPSGAALVPTWSKLSGPGVVTFGDVNQPATTASFSAAGIYVLRLEASDSQKGGFDDVAVSVLPRPNRPPDITSEPTTEFSLGAAPAGSGELVNIAPWTSTQYELNSQPDALWVKDAANNTVTQTVNADSSFLLSDFNLTSEQMEGTWRVNTSNDDDFVGFVFGYQNAEHFYLFDWKQASQSDPLGAAEVGMSLKVFSAESALTGRDFWPTAGNGARVRTLYHNTVPWDEFTDYRFTLRHYPGEIKITVRRGETVLADFTVNDSTYTNGRFGFYNYSQEQVKYSGFRRLPLTQGTYTYDVEASDPDGDALTYALTAAPAGMSINAATGLISWPATSRDAGDHNVTVRAQDPHGAFDAQSFTLTILNQNQAPAVNAGPDRTLAVNGTATLDGTVADDGLPRGASVTSAWSMVSGPGLVAFADAASPATTATFSEAGTYVLRLSATDTALGASDEAVITVTPPNQAPAANAGADLTVTQPGTARLDGTATDDGLPAGSALVVNWTQVSGPGVAAFANSGSAATSATFSEPGAYVLRLTASDTELTGSDDVRVTVKSAAPNQGPSVNAGPDQTAVLNANLLLNAGNDEQLVGGEIRGWTEAAGTGWTRGAGGTPESVNGDSFFYAGEAATAELRQDVDVSAFGAGIAAGTQAFEWKAFVRSRAEALPDTARIILEYRNAANTAMIARLDSGDITSTGGWQSLDDTRAAPAGTGWIRIRLIATRRTGATNDAYFDALSLRPAAGAGVRLSGSVADDGLPAAGALGIGWTKVSGPGTVAFADAAAASTSATFSEAGVYVLRLTASDSQLSGADEVTVTVEPRNLAPVVEAGADQTVTLPATAALSGVVTDDGRPAGAAVTSAWSKVSGPGAVTFSDPNAAISAATFSAEGTYVLRLSAGDSEYAGSDTVTITVKPAPPNQSPRVDAGADQLINPPATSATLSGTVTDDGKPTGAALSYLWTKVSGPGAVTFSNPAAASTTATFAEAGVYVLRLTASDTALTGSDDVRVTLNGTNKAPAVNAGPDQTAAHPATVTLGGSATDDGLPAGSALSYNWGVVSGPGSVTFANSAAAQTTVTFGAAGTYVLRLSASDSELTAADDVSVTLTTPPVIGINSPADGATITGRTTFVGTVSQGTTWRLEYSLNEEGVTPVWTAISSAGTPVTNGALGVFDPTVLLNGMYTVRLVATNGAGQTTTSSVRAVVDGEQKVGNFTLSFNDLNVPVAGMPIDVTRSYDSRDKRTGDFGVGWRLALGNVRVQETGPVGANWQGTVSGGFFFTNCVQPSAAHTVSVTMPGGKVYKFEATLGPQCSTLYPLRETTISYRPHAGTNASLAPVGDATVYVNATFPGEAQLLDYSSLDEKDFDEYQMTLPSGEVYLLSQQAGLRKMTDANGNTLTIGPNGVTHSSGKSVAFTRDAQGRITRITDPSGAAMSYAYDARGDLVGFTDRENNVSTYTYNSSHGMLSAKDPRGVQPVRNEYDDSGRLVKNIDAFGKTVIYQHDADGRRETITDRLGRVTVVEYNQRGNVVRTTDPEGHVKTSTYDSQGNRLSDTDALGRTTAYTYDAQNTRTSITDPLGNTTRFTHNARKLPLTVTDPMGRVTTHTYDANGNLLSTKDSQGNTTSSTYSAAGLLQTATDAQGNVMRFEHDASGRVTKETNAQGDVTTYTYDPNGNRLTQTETRTVPASAAVAAPSGSLASGFAAAEEVSGPAVAEGEAVAAPAAATETLTTTMEYDKLDRLVKVIYPDGSAVRTEYDSAGRKSAEIDQLGRRTAFEYDAMGNLVRTTFADGAKVEQTYDADGRVVKTIDRAGRATAMTYDALGRLEKITYADGSSKTAAYDALGRMTSAVDERGNRTTFEYDPNCGCSNRVIKVTDAHGNASSSTYDANGNRVTTTDARGNTTRYEYDTLNRPNRVLFADGTSYAYVYDSLGRVASRTDPAGKTTRFEYDGVGRLLKSINALNQATTYAYDDLGYLLSNTDANNHTTTYEYDKLGRRVRRTLPAGMSETFGYNAAGELTSRTDFNGKTTTYAYDLMGRMLSKTPDASFNQPAVSYTYTPVGLRASMTDASGTTTYEYDARHRLKSKQTPQGALAYTYDAAGNLLTKRSSNAGGLSVNYAYDAQNRLASVTDNRLGATQTVYDYDQAGNLAGFTYANGVRTDFAYNALNRLTAVTSGKANTLASYAYTLGAAGNRLSVVEHGGRQVNYAYDDLYRLTGETVSGDPAGVNGSVGYTFDAVGNRKTQTSTLPGIASATYVYDANDRLVSDSSDANGNTLTSDGKTYQFDFENRLTEMNGGAVRVVYDGDGNRVSKTAGGVTVNYLVDENTHTGYAQVAEELVGGQVQRVYTYGHDLISQNQLLGGEWKASFYGYDGHGSVRYLTDAAGAVTDTYDYDAFGNILRRTGATPNDYLYAGEQYDAHLGLQYLRARYMNHGTGRFWTQDTYEGQIFDPVSLHKYLYANADPVNNIDPSGNFSLGEMNVSMSIHSTLSGMGGLAMRAIIWWVKKALYGAIAGAVGGAIYGGVDAALGDGEILAGVLDGAKGGAVMGAIFGPVAAFKAAIPILTALGIGLSIPGAIESWQNGYHAQAIFRVAAPLLPWAIGKLRQLIGPLRLSRSGNGVTLTGDPDGPNVPGGGNGSGGSGSGGSGGPPGGGGCPGGRCGGGNGTGSGGTCFVAGTLVQTRDGEKPIEEVTAGDVVLSTNPAVAGQSASLWQPVTRLYERRAPVVIDINVGKTKITATPEHPFWVVGAGWTAAGELRRGSALLTKGGVVVNVDSVERREGAFTVYNFEVADSHTYYVSPLGILVHNQCGKFPDTPEQMDDLLGFPGNRLPDVNPQTGQPLPGRNRVDWDITTPGGRMRITYEAHPYHPNAPDYHRLPHWHVDWPGRPAGPHPRFSPGDMFPNW